MIYAILSIQAIREARILFIKSCSRSLTNENWNISMSVNPGIM